VSAKALAYAEGELGVHKVYEDAQAAYASLEETITTLAKERDEKRRLEFALADREQEIIQQAWIDNPDMSQTRMDKHVKTLIHADTGWKELRTALSAATFRVDTLEGDQRLCEHDIKIAVSRMGELGGYLHYLAEVKRAASTPQPEKTGETAP
jgi:hypothetical protein